MDATLLEEEERTEVRYEKPLFEEHQRTFFTEEIWEQFTPVEIRACMQCSGCHGCR